MMHSTQTVPTTHFHTRIVKSFQPPIAKIRMVASTVPPSRIIRVRPEKNPALSNRKLNIGCLVAHGCGTPTDQTPAPARAAMT